MIIDHCNWDHPGADRYTGTVPAAIAAYNFPIATQRELIAAWERREFTDTVVIDRDSVRGKHFEYGPEVSDMNFGSKGARCASVTRSGWAADHVETAIVLCASDGECVAIPAVCTNVFRPRRVAPEQAALPYQYLGGDEAFAPLAILPAAGYAQGAGPVLEQPLGAAAAGEAPVSFPSFGSSGGGGNTYITSPCTCCTAVAAPIPEPATYLLLALGLAGIAIRNHLKKKD